MSTLQTDIITRLRPRTVGEIIDGAFRLYRRNFRIFLLIVAVVCLPVRLLSYSVDVFLLGRYSLPTARQSIDAMSAIRRRAARAAEAKRDTHPVSTDPSKRKRDTHPSIQPNREGEQ
jgi:hypothetical protein